MKQVSNCQLNFSIPKQQKQKRGPISSEHRSAVAITKLNISSIWSFQATSSPATYGLLQVCPMFFPSLHFTGRKRPFTHLLSLYQTSYCMSRKRTHWSIKSTIKQRNVTLFIAKNCFEQFKFESGIIYTQRPSYQRTKRLQFPFTLSALCAQNWDYSSPSLSALEI